MLVYFPSCNFTRTFPKTSEAAKEFMKKQGIRVEGCCRPGHKNLTAGEQALVVCQTCTLLIGERRPDIPLESAWEYLDSLDIAWPDYHGEEITVQDCWRARNRDSLHTAVRSLLNKMNFTVVELENNRQNADFDGEWLYRPSAPANIKMAPQSFEAIQPYIQLKSPEEIQALMQAHASQIKTDRVVDYCTACHTGLLHGGANAVNLMELLMKTEG